MHWIYLSATTDIVELSEPAPAYDVAALSGRTQAASVGRKQLTYF